MVWRTLEAGGICAATGGVAGFLLMPVLVWRDIPALVPAVVLLGIGAAF